MGSAPPGPVTLQELEEASVEPPKPDQNARDERAFFSHKENMHKAELGWVGAVWGSKSEKPGNIAAIVAIVLLIFIAILLIRLRDWDKFGSTLAAMMSTITLILGYLFGSSSRD